MATKYNPEPVGQQVFDRISDAFNAAVSKDVKVKEKALAVSMATFKDLLLKQIGGDAPGDIAGYYYHWAPVTDDWKKRKKSGEGNRFGVGIKGLLQANIERIDFSKAYGDPKVQLLGKGKAKLIYGPVPRDFKATLSYNPFPKVGRAVGRLIAPFARRQQQILRWNEPTSRLQRGKRKHDRQPIARPLLFPMYRFYVEQVLPKKFKDAQ